MIAIEALSLGDPPQGIGAYSLNLVRALSDDPGPFEYAVFLPERGLGHFTGIGTRSVRLVPCPVPAGRALRVLYQQFAFPRLVRESGARLLHSVGNLLPAAWRGPAVLTVHDLDFAVHPGASPLARRLLFGILTPPSLRAAAAVLTDSEYSAQCIRTRYPDAARKLAVAPLGAPPRREPADADLERVRAAYGLDGPYFLAVGTLERRKRLDVVLSAFDRYRQAGGRARLVMAGRPGYGHAELARAVEGLAHRAEIIRPGYVPADDLPPLYAGAAALLFLSESEGFGLPALEAMAAGCPVIAARAGALPETCGGAALMVEPGDAEAAARAMAGIADPRRRAETAAAGARNLERFSWAAHAATVRRVYADLLKNGV